MATNANDAESESSSLLSSLVEAIKNPDDIANLEIRAKYHEILENVKNLSVRGGYTTEDLTLLVAQINRVFEGVNRTEEACLDAKVLKEVSLLGKANIEKTQSSLLTFNCSDFADNLINFIDNGESLVQIFEPDSDSLQRLSEAMGYLYRTTYGLEPLYGALDWQPPPKPVREQQRKASDQNRDVVKKVIERVEDSRTNEENQVEEVMRIFEVLKKVYREESEEPIPFLCFVLDPQCFFTTVQNIFHTSFLIRDGHIEFLFNEHKIPCLKPVRRKQREERKRHTDSHHNKQSVIDMNVSLWQEAINVLEIDRPMIPNISKKMTNKRSH